MKILQNMKRIINRLLFFLGAILPYVVFSQANAPVWLDGDVRNMQFPQNSFYTGFSEIPITPNEGQEKALNRAKQKALGELSDRVRVMVKSDKVLTDISISGSGIEEQISSKFSSLVNTTSQTEVTGSKVDSYYDSKNRIVYAFAYVSRAELSNYYQNQISLWLNKVEGAIQTAGELAEKGYKMKASKQCESVADDFAKVLYAQDLLTAIKGNADDSVLQQSRSERIRNILVQTITDLENSTYIYLQCNETVNGQTVVHIADRLPGMLTEKGCGCNFTDLKEEADYVINIEVHLSRCNDAPDNVVFCYANATVKVFNIHTLKTLMPKIEETKGGWTSGNKAKATEEAFNALADKIVDKVMPMIKN